MILLQKQIKLEVVGSNLNLLMIGELTRLKKKGSADPVTLSHLDKINKSLDRYQDSLNKIESVLNRPASNGHKLNETNCEYKNAFCKYVKKGLESDIANL